MGKIRFCFWVLLAFVLSPYFTLPGDSLSLTPMAHAVQLDSPKKLSPSDLQRIYQQMDKQGNGGLQTPNGDSLANEKSQKQETSQPTKVPSKLEQQYRVAYGSPLSGNLTQFGYNLFENASVKTSNLAIPSPDYLIGPGDKLRIRLWGADVDAEFIGIVERDGSINVPKIGIIAIAGTPYGKVDALIRSEAGKYVQGINVSVSLVELRSLEIYVVGPVNKPGLHMVPAFSTVFDALIAAQGVKKSGSLRNIEIYRQGKLLGQFDLYDLLLHGRQKTDIMLGNRDVVFVARLGKTAAVAGAVGEEAIFELKGEDTLGELLDLSGGTLPQASGGRLYLRRYVDNHEFTVKDIDTLALADDWRRTPILDGDLLELEFLPEGMPQVVTLTGHVWKPAVFQFRSGMQLSELFPAEEVLMPGAVTSFAILQRYNSEFASYVAQRFPLTQLFSGQFDLPLEPHDKVEVLSREKIGITEEVTISGAVWQPGQIPFSKGLTLGGLVAMSGGEKFGANMQAIELSRQVIEEGRVLVRHHTLDFATQKDFVLLPFDYVFVRQLNRATDIQTVSISGEVKYPGEYRIKEGERLSQVIERAGGYLPSAYFFGAKFLSERAQKVQQQSINDLLEELELRSQQAMLSQTQIAVSKESADAAHLAQQALTNVVEKLKKVRAEGRVAIFLADLQTFKGSTYDFFVEDGDALHIPAKPNFVSAIGSVYSPNSYHYEPNRTVDFYLNRCGGPTKNADEDYIYILKANGEVMSKAQGGMLFSRFSSYRLMPGDTLVVPEDFERVPYLRIVKDVADIVFKIATTAGVAIAAL